MWFSCFAFPGSGALIGVFSGFFYALSGALTKLLKDSFQPPYISWARSLLILATSLTLALVCQKKFWVYERKVYIYLISAGMLGTAVNVAQYFSFQLINLSTAVTIISTTPVFLAMFTCFTKGRQQNFSDFILILMCLTGIILCTQPSLIFSASENNSDGSIVGQVLALAVAVGWAIDSIILKKVEDTDVISITIVDCLVCCSTLSVYLLFSKNTHFDSNAKETVILISNGICSLFACTLLLLAIKANSPLFSSIGRTAEIPFSVLFDFIIFNKVPNWISILGIIIVMVGILLFSLIEFRSHRNMDVL